MGLRRQAISGIKWTSTASVVTTGLSFVQLALLGRLLLPDDFGLMAMIMVVIGFAQAYADMGVSNAIIHYQDTSREHLSTLYWLNILMGALIFLVLVAVTPIVVAFYHEPRLARLLLLSSTAFLIMPIGQQFQMLLERELMFDRIAFAEIASSVLGSGTAIISALAGLGVYSLVLGQLMQASVKTFLFTLAGFKRWRPLLYFSGKDLKGYLRFGLYQVGERSINYLGWNLDKLLIGSLLGARALGFYNIAYQLMVQPFSVFNPIITRVAFPVFAKIQHDAEGLRRWYLEAIGVIAFILFPVYAGMITLAKPLFLMMVGQNWLPAVPVFQVLCILGFFYSLGNPLGSLLLAKGRADIGFYLNVLMIMLYGTAVWMGAKAGVVGIAWALVVVTAGVLFPTGFWIRRVLVGMRSWEYIHAFLPFLLAAGASGLAVYGLSFALPWHNNIIAQLFILALPGAAFYGLVVIVWQRPFLTRLWALARD